MVGNNTVGADLSRTPPIYRPRYASPKPGSQAGGRAIRRGEGGWDVDGCGIYCLDGRPWVGMG